MVQMFGRDWQPENTQKKYNRKSCTAQAQLTLKVCFSLFLFVLPTVKWKILCFLICSFTIGKIYYHLLQTSPVPCYKTAVNCRPKVMLKVWSCCRSVHTSISQYLHCRIVSLWVPHVCGTGLKRHYILTSVLCREKMYKEVIKLSLNVPSQASKFTSSNNNSSASIRQ